MHLLFAVPIVLGTLILARSLAMAFCLILAYVTPFLNLLLLLIALALHVLRIRTLFGTIL
jgi:hypothetical protein